MNETLVPISSEHLPSLPEVEGVEVMAHYPLDHNSEFGTYISQLHKGIQSITKEGQTDLAGPYTLSNDDHKILVSMQKLSNSYFGLRDQLISIVGEDGRSSELTFNRYNLTIRLNYLESDMQSATLESLEAASDAVSQLLARPNYGN